MHLQIKKTFHLAGKIMPPSSKSQTIRAILIAALANGTSVIKRALDSADTQHALAVAQQLGAHIHRSTDSLSIESEGLPFSMQADTINTGDSGIATLFTLPLLGLRSMPSVPVTLNCGDQMRQRPIAPLVGPLRKLGLTIETTGGEEALPARVSGRLMGGEVDVEGEISQYVSALLIALPCALEDSVVRVNQLCERPYVMMTLNWLDQQGIRYQHHREGGMDRFMIQGRQVYRPFHTVISADFSSASYLIAAGVLMPGCVELAGLNMDEPQGDKALISILQAMGADIVVEPHRIVIHGGKPLTGVSIDMRDMPDLLPTLAVIGTYAAGQTVLHHVAHARKKETDRITAMADGLARLGASLEVHEDGLTLHASQLRGTQVKGYNDHRTVMALSLAGMIATGVTRVEGSAAIHKTFPGFVSAMRSLGAQMEEVA